MSHHHERALANEQGSGDFAMTFAEIAKVEGMKRGTAWTIYQRGLRKLRRQYPGILGMLREAAAELDSNREAKP